MTWPPGLAGWRFPPVHVSEGRGACTGGGGGVGGHDSSLECLHCRRVALCPGANTLGGTFTSPRAEQGSQLQTMRGVRDLSAYHEAIAGANSKFSWQQEALPGPGVLCPRDPAQAAGSRVRVWPGLLVWRFVCRLLLQFSLENGFRGYTEGPKPYQQDPGLPRSSGAGGVFVRSVSSAPELWPSTLARIRFQRAVCPLHSLSFWT